MDIMTCMAALKELYGADIKAKEGCVEESKLALLPDGLKEFYSRYQSMKLPFGEINTVDSCLESAKIGAMKEEGWFCFGQDKFFSVWLCRKTPDEEGLSFAIYDIGWEDEDEDTSDGLENNKKEFAEAAFETIGEMLQFLSDKYMESESATQCSVYLSGYCKEAMKEVLAVKKAFHSPTSMLDFKEKAEKGSCLVKEKFHYYQAKKILKELNLQYLKVTLKKQKGWF